jgi:hypothetical protein
MNAPISTSCLSSSHIASLTRCGDFLNPSSIDTLLTYLGRRTLHQGGGCSWLDGLSSRSNGWSELSGITGTRRFGDQDPWEEETKVLKEKNRLMEKVKCCRRHRCLQNQERSSCNSSCSKRKRILNSSVREEEMRRRHWKVDDFAVFHFFWESSSRL